MNVEHFTISEVELYIDSSATLPPADYNVGYYGKTFAAVDVDTLKSFQWNCSCSYDELTPEDHKLILEYRGVWPDESVCTIEDWWMSGHKMKLEDQDE